MGAKRLINALLNAVSHTLPQSLSDSKSGSLQGVWVRVLPSALLDGNAVANFRAVVSNFDRRDVVTVLVTIRTHTNTHHPANTRKEAHKRAP